MEDACTNSQKLHTGRRGKAIKPESETFKQHIGGNNAGIACSMQGYKFEKKIFKLPIGSSTASIACSMQGYKYAGMILCSVLTVLGSLVCQPEELAALFILAFCAYTDMNTAQVYVFPIRVCIACELVGFVLLNGLPCKEYGGLLLCVAIIVFMRIIRAYAQGDMEIFIMLVMAAGISGEEIVSYFLRLMTMSALIFVLLFGICFIIYSLIRKLKGKKIVIVKKAPMVPSIAIAFILCHLCR